MIFDAVVKMNHLQVVESGEGWRLAVDDTECKLMQYRFFVRVTVMDASGSADIVLSNDQVKLLLSNILANTC